MNACAQTIALALACCYSIGAFAEDKPAKRDDLDVTMQIIVDPNAKLPDEVVRRIPLPTSRAAVDSSGQPSKSDAADKGQERAEEARELGREAAERAKERAREAQEQREEARNSNLDRGKGNDQGGGENNRPDPNPPDRPNPPGPPARP